MNKKLYPIAILAILILMTFPMLTPILIAVIGIGSMPILMMPQNSIKNITNKVDIMTFVAFATTTSLLSLGYLFDFFYISNTFRIAVSYFGVILLLASILTVSIYAPNAIKNKIPFANIKRIKTINRLIYSTRIISVIGMCIGTMFIINLTYASRIDITNSFHRYINALNATYAFNIIATLFMISYIIMIAYVITYIGRQSIKKDKSEYYQNRREQMREKVEIIQPKSILYHSGPISADLKHSIAIMKKTNEPYIIILRDKKTFNDLQKLKVKNIFLCPIMADIEKLVTDSVKSIFYINNRAKNIHIIRFYHLSHVLLQAPLNIEDLSPSYGMFTHRLLKNISDDGAAELIHATGYKESFLSKVDAVTYIVNNSNKITSEIE